jgi:hypothetical protein
MIPAGPPVAFTGEGGPASLEGYVSRTPLSFLITRGASLSPGMCGSGLVRAWPRGFHYVVRIAFGLLSSVSGRVEPVRAGT